MASKLTIQEATFRDIQVFLSLYVLQAFHAFVMFNGVSLMTLFVG